MSDRTRIVVTGVTGRMGRVLAETVLAADEAILTGATVRPGNPAAGRDLGTVLGRPDIGLIVTDDALEALAVADAVLDFTTPAATVETATLAAQARAVHVIGTTGLAPADLAHLTAAAHHCVIVRAGNMSLGVNLLARLTEIATRALGPAFDIEIVETHHAGKRDAPSGTALMLGQAAAAARGRKLEDVAVPGRQGSDNARRAGEIGFASVRAGDVVGEHQVILAGAGERVVLGHIATDRALFARGALRAALWGRGQKPGEYDMQDVLGL